MLFWAQNSNALLTGQWVLLFAPGLCIALLATSLTLINFGVDGISNPRLREGSNDEHGCLTTPPPQPPSRCSRCATSRSSTNRTIPEPCRPSTTSPSS